MGEPIDENAYMWFESLANVINLEMGRGANEELYKGLVEAMSSHREIGDNIVKNCIDVAFVENLFWDVSDRNTIKRFWQILPENLKALYIGFHGRLPDKALRGSKSNKWVEVEMTR